MSYYPEGLAFAPEIVDAAHDLLCPGCTACELAQARWDRLARPDPNPYTPRSMAATLAKSSEGTAA